MLDIRNAKGWKCVAYDRRIYGQEQREMFVYQNPDDPLELEAEVFAMMPVRANQVHITMNLADDPQQTLPGLEVKEP